MTLIAQELLERNGIRLSDYKPGQHCQTCPRCSAKRSKAHQSLKVLSVKIDADGATWHCNHCGWAGPEKGNGKSNGAGGEFAATYDYPGFQKVRYPKGHEPRFRIRHRNSRGDWEWGAGSADTSVLYRKDEIDEAIALGRIIVPVEGEKDADALWAIGIAATCNMQGANEPGRKPKWKIEHSKQVAGADLVVLGDHDSAGYAHQDATCKLSLGVAKRVRILKLAEHWPDCPKGGDISDWLAAGHTREELDALFEQAPDYDDFGASDGGESKADDIGGDQDRLPPLPFIDMSRWDDEPVPEQEWTVHNRIPNQQCVLFSGQGGAGKSTVQLQQAVAHVLARDWLGTMPKPGPALFVDAEDPPDVVHRRLAAIARHYGVTFAELIKGGLHSVSLFGQDAVLATVGRSGKVEPTPLYQRLYQAAGDIKPVSIGIAASANVFAGNEIDRTQVQQFVSLLARLAIVANGSVSLISHPSVSGIVSDSGISGNTQWHNSVRARSYVKGVKPEDGEEPDNELRELIFKKNNYGPLAETILLKYQSGLFLPVAGPGSLDRATQEARAEEVFLALLDRFTRANRNVSDKASRTYAPSVFAKEPEAKSAGLNSKAFEAAMRRLFAAGTIWNEDVGKPSRPQYRIARKA